MLNQNLWQITADKTIRVLQVAFLAVAVWFFFWAHIYDMITWNKTFVESLQSSTLHIVIYATSIIGLIVLEIYLKNLNKISAVSPSTRIPQDLQTENEQLNQQEQKFNRVSPAKIGIPLLVFGALLLAFAVLIYSSILAFMGLGLTFWGCLFSLVSSTKFVRSDLLDSTVVSYYASLDRIIHDLNYTGKAVNIPPYPKDVYLPQHLAGLKETILFITAENSTGMPNIEEMAKKQFIVENPRGICLIPPGATLANQFEKELNVDFTKIDQASFFDELLTVVVNKFELASNLEAFFEKELINIKITDSVYSSLYSREPGLKSIYSVGCPLTSAIACALAIKTGKPVAILSIKIFPDLRTMEVGYQVIEG